MFRRSLHQTSDSTTKGHFQPLHPRPTNTYSPARTITYILETPKGSLIVML